ncbi:hypothetical protein RB195_020208 [Necator americanus]
MSFETISVRMNRSDPSIRWGFTLRQQGNRITVATVDKDSLSDKAGMKSGDEVDAVCGRNAMNMGVNEANNIIDSSYQEVHFNLRRFVTSHTCLPWTLTEQDNKLVVDDMQPGYGSGFGGDYGLNSYGRSTSAHTKSSWDKSNQRSTSVPYRSNYQSNYSTQSSTRGAPHYGSYVATNSQPRMYHSPSTYSRQEQSSYSKTQSNSKSQGNGHIPGYSIHTKTNFTPGDNVRPHGIGFTSGDNVRPSGAGDRGSSNVNPTYTTNFGAQRHQTSRTSETIQPPAAQNYSFNNGVTTTAYKPSSGGLPLNQATFIQTSQLSPSLHSSAVSPGGTKILYHSPSPRTRQLLSPYADIQHLQYNSPMNVYSAESAAEQYTQQTGRPIEVPSYRTKSPAYLTSETKKLIEAQEHNRGHRIASPSAQSSSFKRISQAVGEPIN